MTSAWIAGSSPAMTKERTKEKIRRRNADRRKALVPRLRPRPRLERQAPSIGVPPRFRLRRPNATTRLQFRASRAGAFKRALPANRPATVQRCFSQTGRNAGRADIPEAARERVASPRAGTALARRLWPAGHSPSDEARFESACNVIGDVRQLNRDEIFSTRQRSFSSTYSHNQGRIFEPMRICGRKRQR